MHSTSEYNVLDIDQSYIKYLTGGTATISGMATFRIFNCQSFKNMSNESKGDWAFHWLKAHDFYLTQ